MNVIKAAMAAFNVDACTGTGREPDEVKRYRRWRTLRTKWQAKCPECGAWVPGSNLKVKRHKIPNTKTAQIRRVLELHAAKNPQLRSVRVLARFLGKRKVGP